MHVNGASNWESDTLRLPPMRQAEAKQPFRPIEQPARYLRSEMIWQGFRLMIVNNPLGMPVHGGTQVSAGLIEMLRSIYPRCTDLELVRGCVANFIGSQRAFFLGTTMRQCIKLLEYWHICCMTVFIFMRHMM